MTTTHPTSGTTGGNRGLPIACPACNEPALQHDNGAIYCSDTDRTYSAEEMAAAQEEKYDCAYRHLASRAGATS